MSLDGCFIEPSLHTQHGFAPLSQHFEHISLEQSSFAHSRGSFTIFLQTAHKKSSFKLSSAGLLSRRMSNPSLTLLPALSIFALDPWKYYSFWAFVDLCLVYLKLSIATPYIYWMRASEDSIPPSWILMFPRRSCCSWLRFWRRVRSVTFYLNFIVSVVSFGALLTPKLNC